MKILTLSILSFFFLPTPFVHAQVNFLPIVEETLELSFHEEGGTALSFEEERFLLLINRFRKELNLRPLKIEARLQAAATKHNVWMHETGRFGHYGPERKDTVGTRTQAEGIAPTFLTEEIIATGSFTGKDTFLQWFFSPSHLQSMIDDDLDHVGISRTGCDESRPHEEESCHWTVDFAELEDHSHDHSAQSQHEIFAKTSSLSAEDVLAAGEAVVGPLDNRKARFSLQIPAKEKVVDGWKAALDWLSP